MAWFDQLTTASFRGVAFQVDTIDITAGDNTVLREYPFQDLPTVFRLGEGVEELKFSAYVIGDDYTEQRDALRAVLTGLGTLVHPTAGYLEAYCVGKFTIKENPTAEGGMARFDLTFVRAEARRYPVGVASTGTQAVSAAAAASTAAQDQFAVDFNLLALPGWVADRALANLNASLDGVWAQVKGVTGGATGEVGGLDDFTSGLITNYQQLRTGLNDLVRMPRLLAGQVAALFQIPTEISAALSRDYQGAFAWAFDLGAKLPRNDFEVSVIPAAQGNGHAGVGDAGLVIYGTGSTAALSTGSLARTQLTQVIAATDQLFETLAICGYVQAASAVDLAGYDQALALRKAVNDQCTRLLTDASTQAAPGAVTATAWHGAVQALHTAALSDLQARSRNLAALTSYTPAAFESIWAISYRLFGTADYADEIMAMNPAVRHPLLCPPGKPLRIVRHD